MDSYILAFEHDTVFATYCTSITYSSYYNTDVKWKKNQNKKDSRYWLPTRMDPVPIDY